MNVIEYFMILSLYVLCKLVSKLCEFDFLVKTKILMYDLIMILSLMYLKVSKNLKDY